MNTAAKYGRPATAEATRRRSAVWRFVREALSHATWKLAGIAALLVVMRWASIPLTKLLQSQPIDLDAWMRLPVTLMMATCILVAVLCAEQAVRAGVRRLFAYLVAVLLGAATAGLFSGVSDFLMAALGFYGGDAHYLSWRSVACANSGALFITADTLVRGGLASFIYANYQRMLHAQRSLRAAEIERAEVERRVAEERLHALRARVDPDRLFEKLGQVQSLYELMPAQADRALNALIAELRAATAQAPV